MKLFLIAIGISMALVGLTIAQKNRKFLQTTAKITVNTKAEMAFNYIVPIDLTLIFKRHKRLPAVVRTDEKETWFKPGLTRVVYFDDGSRASETLLTVTPNQSFTYQIEDFTSQLRFLAKRIEGNWQFTDLENGQTKIEWTYKIIPKNFMARSIIRWFVLEDINGLLNNSLLIIKNNLDLKNEK